MITEVIEVISGLKLDDKLVSVRLFVDVSELCVGLGGGGKNILDMKLTMGLNGPKGIA